MQIACADRPCIPWIDQPEGSCTLDNRHLNEASAQVEAVQILAKLQEMANVRRSIMAGKSKAAHSISLPNDLVYTQPPCVNSTGTKWLAYNIRVNLWELSIIRNQVQLIWSTSFPAAALPKADRVEQALCRFAWSDNSAFTAVACEGSSFTGGDPGMLQIVCILHVQSGVMHTLTRGKGEECHFLLFSPDSKRLLLRQLRYNTGGAHCISYLHRYFALQDGTWYLLSESEVPQQSIGRHTAVVFSMDAEHVASALSGHAHLLTVRDASCVRLEALPISDDMQPERTACQVAFTADGTKLLHWKTSPTALYVQAFDLQGTQHVVLFSCTVVLSSDLTEWKPCTALHARSSETIICRGLVAAPLHQLQAFKLTPTSLTPCVPCDVGSSPSSAS